MEQIQQKMLDSARKSFASGKTLSLKFRLEQLKNLKRFYTECSEEIISALYEDLKKPRLEAELYEVEILKCDVSNIIRNFSKYTSREALPLNSLACLDKAFVHKDPFGVVLIIGTFNYPFQMSLMPLAGAIAAGNAVIIKPSELTPKSAETIAKLLPLYIDKECYQIYEGGVAETVQLLTNKFDYIFATASVTVGKSIMAAAAKHLTPLTLELGGKSPVYIDESSNFYLAAKRILWGKCMNLGQTCIAPDYVLCSERAELEFTRVCKEVMFEWYGKNMKDSPYLPRIVNERHFNRLKKLLHTTKGQIVYGGATDKKDLWIEPTIVVNVDDRDSVMEDEIFGPILPILRANSPEEAIRFIVSKPKPLSLYIFSNKKSVVDDFINKTSCGGVCVNDTVWQNGWEGLPFGGVGASGFGNYHGKYSVETFCHKKSVLIRGFSFLSEKLGEARYPPYTQGSINFFTFVVRHFHKFNLTLGRCTSHVFASILGAIGLFFYLKYFNYF